MDASSVLISTSCPKYTSSFLSQLQTEWNEFVLEISHSTPRDIGSNCNLESSKKHNTKAAFVESLNKFNQTSGGNILIPVPLHTLKKLFSPSKGNTDDICKNDFFNEIKENLNLTKLSCKKLQKLLSIDESSEISDFPSPSLPKHSRNSAPPNLFPKKKSKPKSTKNDFFKIVNRMTRYQDENLPKKNDFKLNNNFKIPDKEKLPSLKVHNKCLNNSNTSATKVKTESITPKKITKSIRKGIKNEVVVESPANDNRSNQYNQRISGSDSSSLFYTFKQPKKSWKPTIVCTYFNHKELSRIYQIVKKLGFYEIENHVSSRTTHLVCGSANKTINLCKAIARGCWILEKEWITSSDEANRWLLEERFEKKNLSPAVLENRLKRQKSGHTYRCDVFTDCGSMYVSNKCSQPSIQDLKELILLGGGRLEESPERAVYIIGSTPKCHYVKEIWILNCILQGYVIDVNKYVRNKS